MANNNSYGNNRGPSMTPTSQRVEQFNRYSDLYGNQTDGQDYGFGAGLGGSGEAVGSDRYISDQAYRSGYNAFGEPRQTNAGRRYRAGEHGLHTGKGPKGWRPSDESIRERVCECLEMDSHIDASELEVSVKDRIVTLSGKVEHRPMKRHAEDLIENLPGVVDVQNRITIDQSFFQQAKEAIMGQPSDAGNRAKVKH